MKNTFKKEERLRSKKQISRLFNEGKSFFRYPFRIFFLKEKTEEPALPQVLITVSKRNFKKAVDRNRIKRLVREAYRRNKKPLVEHCTGNSVSVLLGLIYTGKTILSYAEIEKKIILILHHLIEQDEQAAG